MSPPLFGKLALDGRWEHAQRFQVGEFVADREAAEFLGGAEEVACEAFFSEGFVGVRRRGTDVASFVAGFGRAMRDACDIFGLLAALGDLGIPVTESFLFAEVGAEGAWNSVGTFRIPDPCAADLDPLFMLPVAHETAHDKAVEFAYDNGDGTTHWIARFVSLDGLLSRDLLEQSLVEFCQRTNWLATAPE